ncbi:MAG: hypothetical protein ABFS22_11325 [Pseudomonadota bacterium]
MKIKYLVLAIVLSAVEANADNSTLDAALGGGIGGAAGAAIGNEVGGRDGAIIGGALGGGIGTAIATDGKEHGSKSKRTIKHRTYDEHDYYDVEYGHPHHHAQPRIPQGHLPPPGQCRVWYSGRSPGHQPPPGDCRALRHRVPAGAQLVRG